MLYISNLDFSQNAIVVTQKYVFECYFNSQYFNSKLILIRIKKRYKE